ncbi:hypothetical protein DFH29DRAFT_322403 [Suillus ampliporus]|nr:hypothetical protein DFH29DRAFT_322403 [Suillus ampliporus]
MVSIRRPQAPTPLLTSLQTYMFLILSTSQVRSRNVLQLVPDMIDHESLGGDICYICPRRSRNCRVTPGHTLMTEKDPLAKTSSMIY